MEKESKEKLASVSSLVTVFENSRYGVVGVGRVARVDWWPPSSSSAHSGPPSAHRQALEHRLSQSSG